MILIIYGRYFIAGNFQGWFQWFVYHICRGDNHLAIFTALWKFYNDFSFIFWRWQQPGQFHSETVRTEYSRVWPATPLTAKVGLFFCLQCWWSNHDMLMMTTTTKKPHSKDAGHHRPAANLESSFFWTRAEVFRKLCHAGKAPPAVNTTIMTLRITSRSSTIGMTMMKLINTPTRFT